MEGSDTHVEAFIREPMQELIDAGIVAINPGGTNIAKMIMAIPPYVGLSVSILSNNQTGYQYCARDESDSNSSECRKPADSPTEPSLTILPKKRSFDVAFLISPDDKRPPAKIPDASPDVAAPVAGAYENDTIRSAFKKVGLGFAKPESRSPSPIDPIRTPSPPERRSKLSPPVKSDVVAFAGSPAPGQRTRAPPPPTDKSPLFLGGNLLAAPVGLGRTHQSLIPAPIFSAHPMLPTSFVTASLLPPSLAALTLPAQNVCAKCNVSFRMTSDLVYHMRSHHKNDHSGSDQQRRRRELDKLKCPVCNESFRERHHLTRHMTAHQDKEGDNIDPEAEARN